jgi:hypothetical protein
LGLMFAVGYDLMEILIARSYRHSLTGFTRLKQDFHVNLEEVL